MIRTSFTTPDPGRFFHDGRLLDRQAGAAAGLTDTAEAASKTMAARILAAHNAVSDAEGAQSNDPSQGEKRDTKESRGDRQLRITFDALASHDITFVGIIQTARASGMQSFPLPYVLTNCHNSLCAVGGTINEDDHLFGLSAARRYGGDYVPPHLAVIHQYVREMLAGGGKMILGSDSHTRYGALGTLGIGEGGPELVKQLLGRTYDIARPEVVAVYLEGAPLPGVGPQDVAIALIKAVFPGGLVTNKILEFIGPGVEALSVEYRMGIDVMTTETACLSSIWLTDDKVRDRLALYGRKEDHVFLRPGDGAWYDGLIHINLAAIEPMIALPFHPSNAWTIREFLDNAEDLLAGIEKEAATMLPAGLNRPNLRSKLRGKDFMTDQGIIAGCSGGTFENIHRAAQILKGRSTGNGEFSLSVYPASQPQYLELVRAGLVADLMEAGVTMKTAFCGPCFGAGDVPAHNAFSIRHTTRNFPNREGSVPSDGQISYAALMDARSIAATARNGGRLTPATALEGLPDETMDQVPYVFHGEIYEKRVYRGFGRPMPETDLIFGPNITDWPSMPPLPEHLLLTAAAAVYDPVTTTDELIPSGETSSYRSNPLRLAEFTLGRKDPEYVGRAKSAAALERERRALFAEKKTFAEAGDALRALLDKPEVRGKEAETGIGSFVFALKPGDGSAREQAASSQKVLGGRANIVQEYATKRYRSNLINWGMLPFILDNAADFGIQPNDAVFIPDIQEALRGNAEQIPALLYQGQGKEAKTITLRLPGLTENERAIILAGCLMNYYAQEK